jgi:hypothetical protein
VESVIGLVLSSRYEPEERVPLSDMLADPVRRLPFWIG